jgi:lon-related putative ATP-dependent protease
MTIATLSAESLCNRCNPDQFDFETTEELEDLSEVIGQPRAVEAVRFGVGIDQEGYNLFALGTAGTGKRELVQRYFNEAALEDPTPSDWCYVNNFKDTHKPRALELPAGKGSAFRDDMDQLIEDMQHALSGAFESEEYRNRTQEIQEALQEEQTKKLEQLREEAKDEDVAMMRTPAGIVFAPMREGEVVSPEEFQNLPEEERDKLEKRVEELQDRLRSLLSQMPALQRETRERMEALNREIADFAVGALIDELREKYSDYPEVVAFLDEVREDIVKNVREIVSQTQSDQGSQGRGRGRVSVPSAGMGAGEEAPILRRYRVNLLVDNQDLEGTPVIFEDNPTFQNLIGRVEHLAQLGALITDFNLIKSGALHRANKGYLILETRKLLQQPFAYEGLKRALRSAQVRIESPAQMYSLISTVSLEPEPIELNVKVALLGEPLLYYLLSAYDPEFRQLFKVAADFAERMDRSGESQDLYARLVASLVRENELRHFDRGAVARVIEHSARMIGDGEKLSTKVKSITDLLREADYWAGEAGNGTVTREDVQKAIDAYIFRSDRIRERIQEEIQRKTILIDTEGEQRGQINGLSVLQLGDFAFGRPTRITARARLGKGEVVDIEREVELGGPIHSKGVMILSAFLGSRYTTDRPLSLSASLVFEQSYSGIEGDSASSAELYTLLSAISEVPLRQSLAVTGSVNQHGQIQAIGGVNEKIEGFFDLCRSRGLTGDHGVLIPAANVKHLMLRQDVIEAVEAGEFAVYPVETVDQGIELLTGLPAGEPDEEGLYPEGTVNGAVQRRLQDMAEQRASFARAMKEDEA